MSLETLTQAIRYRASVNPPFGHVVKFDLEGEGLIHWDGTVNPAAIGNDDGAAEVTVSMASDVLQQILDGTVDPAIAYMDGQITVDGDTSVAMKLGALLGE